jgi:hypothetical protein
VPWFQKALYRRLEDLFFIAFFRFLLFQKLLLFQTRARFAFLPCLVWEVYYGGLLFFPPPLSSKKKKKKEINNLHCIMQLTTETTHEILDDSTPSTLFVRCVPFHQPIAANLHLSYLLKQTLGWFGSWDQ